MAHSQWCAVMRGDDPATCLGTVEPVEDQPAGADSDDEIDISRADVPPPNELQVLTSFSAVRPPVVFPGLLAGKKIVQVCFDGQSHASGPRCYAKCFKHDEGNCRKYRFIHNFTSLDDCLVWLVAWQLCGPDVKSQSDHTEFEPGVLLLSQARRHLPSV